MTRRPTNAHALAAAAARAAAIDLDDVAEEVSPPEGAQTSLKTPTRHPGRPKGKRDVAGRVTVYLDEKRLEALRRLAGDRGRSVHSLIIEGVDAVIGKPGIKAWE